MVPSVISHYEILAKLGEGGMGVVYKAHDTTLGRTVALKFLPAHLSSSDADKARFMQEAKAASSLNHPNVCTIYAIEEHEHQLFIAMEFVDGQTLAEKKDSISFRQAVDIGIQAAEGLAAAHEKGIVHRDIKPENIMVRRDGIVQIMDFGLAKLHGPVNASRLTKTGAMMGTVGYMSPEQVQGQEVDHRTDIFSLGVVLYELFAGGSPFKGVHETAVMYEIVNVEPRPISLQKEGLDPRIDEIVLECLEKDRDDRYQSARELAKDLKKFRNSSPDRKSRIYSTSRGEIAPTAAPLSPVTGSGPVTLTGAARLTGRAGMIRPGIVPWALSVILLIALAAVWLMAHRPSPERMVARFAIRLADDQALTLANYPALAISHDGTALVYRADNTLYLRTMNSMEPVALSGLGAAASPFFSPDDKWLGFFSNGKLEKVLLGGGTPIDLADVPDNRGAAWNRDGSIVFAEPAGQGLSLINENGGAVRRITTIDSVRHERTHRWPSFLPDGRHVMFTVGNLASPDYYENASIDVADIETGARKTILKEASSARYIDPGYLLFARSGDLFVVPFDAGICEVNGVPVSVVKGVCNDVTTGITDYAVSSNGTLAYVPGSLGGQDRRLVKISTRGEIAALDSSHHRFLEPRLSPDGTKLALVIGNGEDYDVWMFDVMKRTWNRLTFGGLNRSPQWSPDSRHIAYMKRTKDGASAIVVKPYDGSGEEVEVCKVTNRSYVDQWSADGKYLLIDDLDASNSISNLVVVPLKGKELPWNYSRSKFDEYEASISPNGKWIAYLTNETGSYQIYVRSFPGKEGKWQISTDGAEEPRWSPDGKTLYYRKGAQLVSVPVSTSGTFSAGAPAVLINGFPAMNVDSGISYDITPDGREFVTTTPVEGTTFKNIALVLNWTAELNALTAPGK